MKLYYCTVIVVSFMHYPQKIVERLSANYLTLVLAGLRKYMISMAKAFLLKIFLRIYHPGHLPCLSFCHHSSGNRFCFILFLSNNNLKFMYHCVKCDGAIFILFLSFDNIFCITVASPARIWPVCTTVSGKFAFTYLLMKSFILPPILTPPPH